MSSPFLLLGKMNNMFYSPSPEFDAIVVGTGISGGWAAKELTKKGLKTLVIDRGKKVTHPDYPKAQLDNWELPHNNRLTPQQLQDYPSTGRMDNLQPSNVDYFMPYKEQPFQDIDKALWIKPATVGGRSITWGRQVYRWNPEDFTANLNDGVGVDWPIRYTDIEPWYTYVEQFIGVSGKKENFPQVPDGHFLPPMEMNCIENKLKEGIDTHYNDRSMTIGRVANLTQPLHGRQSCKFRNRCNRGCPYGAYFCSLSSTLPTAEATGNMTLLSDTIVTEVILNEDQTKAIGIRAIDKNTQKVEAYYAKVIFLNASSFQSTWILMNSKSDRFQNGLGNDSGELGHNAMDHYIGGGASATTSQFKDKYYKGLRPNGIYIPRFQNLPTDTKSRPYIRGFQIQGRGSRENWSRTIPEASYGLDFKNQLLHPGKWQIGIMGLGEMLPQHRNKISLNHEILDPYGLPTLDIDIEWGENELAMGRDMIEESVHMLTSAGLENVTPLPSNALPGSAVHEMGTARMGNDPRTSVLNKWNQVHTVPNVFVSDGACMTSSACQNPSLTYMALTARAANYAVEQLKNGDLS